jgi:hypothetical protein
MNKFNDVENDGWENTNEDLKIVNECGRKPIEPINVYFNRLAYSKVQYLMKKFRSCEWLAYLIGDKNNRYIKDIFIPSQEASSGAINNVGPKPVGTIGVIHSHHSMGAFFSGTDDAFINQNNDISIVIAHSGIKAMVKWTTPCGYKLETEGNVIVEKENLFDENLFENIINDNIKTTSICNINIDDVDDEKKETIIEMNYIRGLSGCSMSVTSEFDELRRELMNI